MVERTMLFLNATLDGAVVIRDDDPRYAPGLHVGSGLHIPGMGRERTRALLRSIAQVYPELIEDLAREMGLFRSAQPVYAGMEVTD